MEAFQYVFLYVQMLYFFFYIQAIQIQPDHVFKCY